MFSRLLLPLILASAALAGPTIRVAEVRGLASVGTALVILTERTAWTSEAVDVAFTPEALTLTGSWSSSTVPGGGPNVIVTTWHSDRGTHSVSTDCTGRSEFDCTREHRRQLDAAQAEFPPKKGST